MGGHDDKSKWNDSAVAQQLTPAKAKKASKLNTFKNLFSFIIMIYSPHVPKLRGGSYSWHLKRALKRSVGTTCGLFERILFVFSWTESQVNALHYVVKSYSMPVATLDENNTCFNSVWTSIRS